MSISNVFVLLIGAIIYASCIATTNALCPCNSSALCSPIMKNYDKELAVFATISDDNWKKWNWTEITTVILMGNLKQSAELYCYAHSKNIRVVALVGVAANDHKKLIDPDFRSAIANSWIVLVAEYFLDGLNIDIEGYAFTKDVVQGISDITQETYQSLKNINPAYSLSFDIPYSPFLAGCLSGFCYDYVALSKYTDYMIVMDYDMTLDILLASANSPINLMLQSYSLYMNNLSIPANNLVMAVPWYGYDYSCSRFYNKTGHDLCVIAGGKGVQRTYADMMSIFPQNIDGLKWDETAASPYFSVGSNGVKHQYWFDDVKSLNIKYDLALTLKLRGLSMFHAGCLDYSSKDFNTMRETAGMWNAITEYAHKLKQQDSKEWHFRYQSEIVIFDKN